MTVLATVFMLVGAVFMASGFFLYAEIGKEAERCRELLDRTKRLLDGGRQ